MGCGGRDMAGMPAGTGPGADGAVAAGGGVGIPGCGFGRGARAGVGACRTGGCCPVGEDGGACGGILPVPAGEDGTTLVPCMLSLM